MYVSGYYPMGAENDPRAPWNQSDQDPVSMDVEFSCSMRRTANVDITDYVPGNIEKEWDGDGYISVRDDDDFSDTDWLGEYKGQHSTPHQLIKLLRETAKELAEGNIPKKRASFWCSVVKECEGWEIDDEFADRI